MLSFIIDWASSVRNNFSIKSGRVLEVGSYNVNGTIRESFKDATEYVGVDAQSGPCVDVEMYSLGCYPKWGSESFDTVACFETLEHDRTFWRTVDDLRSMVKRGGHLFITTPSYHFPYHGFPKDYYRFSEDTYREVFFTGFDIIDLRTIECTILGVARKP